MKIETAVVRYARFNILAQIAQMQTQLFVATGERPANLIVSDEIELTLQQHLGFEGELHMLYGMDVTVDSRLPAGEFFLSTIPLAVGEINVR